MHNYSFYIPDGEGMEEIDSELELDSSDEIEIDEAFARFMMTYEAMPSNNVADPDYVPSGNESVSQSTSNNENDDENIPINNEDDEDDDEDDEDASNFIMTDDSTVSDTDSYERVDPKSYIADDEDSVIKAIKEASTLNRSQPPDILIDDFVTDLSFHPENDILAVSTITGDIVLYKYSNEANELVNTIEVHTKAIRDIEFSLDGLTIYSTSKDKTIVHVDVESGKFKRIYNAAHESPVYRMYVISENLYSTGDDDGYVKLWDIRDRNEQPIFSLKESEDYISSMITNEAKKILLTTSGDGCLTALNIGSRKMMVQSEPYPEELLCMGLFRNESKIVVGSSKGRMFTFNWNEFGYHNDMFQGPKSPINQMVPITERIAIIAGEEGILRGMQVVPGRNLGIVGQHSLGVEAMDISNNGEIVASCSHDNDVKFWNIKFFEDVDVVYNIKHDKHKELKHNLPSSKYSNVSDFFKGLTE